MATYNVTLSTSAYENGDELMSDKDYILWRMNAKLFARRLPAVVFVGLLAIIGSIGNGLVVCIYKKHLQKSTVNVFIFWLGIFDFSLCFFEMPYKAFDISFPLMYGYPVLCKGFGFIEIFLSMVSIILLLCIAFDRYFVVRRPLKRLTMENINYIIILCIVLGLLFSWPTVIVYGEHRRKTSVPGVYSWGCGVAKEMARSKVIPFWYYFLYAVFGVTCIILVTLYVRIWRSIRKWKYTTIGESMSTPLHRPVPSAGFSRGSTLYHKPLHNIIPNIRLRTSLAEKLHRNSVHLPLNPKPESPTPPQKDLYVQVNKTNVTVHAVDGVAHQNFDGVAADGKAVKHIGGEAVQTVDDGIAVQTIDGVSDQTVDGEAVQATDGIAVQVVDGVAVQTVDEDQSESSSDDKSAGTTSTLKTMESCELGKLVVTPSEQHTVRLVKHARMRRNTIIFGAIAAVFVLSYLPILTIVFLRTSGVYNLKDAPLWQAQVAEVFHRSGYINNAVNPFIYGFLSPWFRVQVKMIFKH